MRPLVPIHQRSGAQLTRARGTEREYPRRGFSVLPDCQSAPVSWKISGPLFARMVPPQTQKARRAPRWSNSLQALGSRDLLDE